MAASLPSLPSEPTPVQFETTLRAALLGTDRPSLFFESLREQGRLLPFLPELQALIGVPQPPKHHGEGDVWNHTLLVVDRAVRYRDPALHKPLFNPFGFMLAALTHDFGKAVCTCLVKGSWHAYGHETAGLPLAEAFLRRFTNDEALISYVLKLVELHMKPNVTAAAHSSVKATNRMFDLSSDPEALICLADADNFGRISDPPPTSTLPFLRERLTLYRALMAQPHVTASDLTAAGVSEPALPDALSYAHKLRLAGIGREATLKQVLAFARALSPSPNI